MQSGTDKHGCIKNEDVIVVVWLNHCYVMDASSDRTAAVDKHYVKRCEFIMNELVFAV